MILSCQKLLYLLILVSLVVKDGLEDEKALVPPWVEPLLLSAFFSVCRTHGDSTRSECNMYCIDCAGHAFCYYCRSARHMDHRVIQVGILVPV